MERIEKRQGTDLRFLLRACVSWLIAAVLLLLLSAALITLADLKASSFSVFGAGVGFLAALYAGFRAKKNNPVPVWKCALFCAVALTISLLTAGFLISGENMDANGILTVAVVTLLGCFSGAILAARTKKLQNKTRVFKRAKRLG